MDDDTNSPLPTDDDMEPTDEPESGSTAEGTEETTDEEV